MAHRALCSQVNLHNYLSKLKSVAENRNLASSKIHRGATNTPYKKALVKLLAHSERIAAACV
jgi:hypothetical protein